MPREQNAVSENLLEKFVRKHVLCKGSFYGIKNSIPNTEVTSIYHLFIS